MPGARRCGGAGGCTAGATAGGTGVGRGGRLCRWCLARHVVAPSRSRCPAVHARVRALPRSSALPEHRRHSGQGVCRAGTGRGRRAAVTGRPCLPARAGRAVRGAGSPGPGCRRPGGALGRSGGSAARRSVTTPLPAGGLRCGRGPGRGPREGSAARGRATGRAGTAGRVPVSGPRGPPPYRLTARAPGQGHRVASLTCWQRAQ